MTRHKSESHEKETKKSHKETEHESKFVAEGEKLPPADESESVAPPTIDDTAARESAEKSQENFDNAAEKEEAQDFTNTVQETRPHLADAAEVLSENEASGFYGEEKETAPAEPNIVKSIHTIEEVDGKHIRTIIPIDEDGNEHESRTEELSDLQVTAFNKHKGMKWESDEEAQIAEVITHYAFGIEKEAFDKGFKHLSKKEKKVFYETAERLGFSDILNENTFAE